MSNLDQLTKPKPQDTNGLASDLKDQIKSVMDTPLTPQTRVVILKYKSCCGCGCDFIDIQRTVPYDSPLKDGDNAGAYQKGDTPV